MILEKFKYIKALVLDVDGVMTDGSLYLGAGGEQIRRFSAKDGFAIQFARQQGLLIWVISGGMSDHFIDRFHALGIDEVYFRVPDKKEVLDKLIQQYEIHSSEIAYIGDDIPDYQAMAAVGLPISPADAVQEIKYVAQYISPFEGGKGVVREVIEKILKLQNKWVELPKHLTHVD